MKIVEEYLLALRGLGYTDCEARFLYLAATHSGYFVPRQFLNLSGAKWGYRTSRLTKKLESRGHATWREHYTRGGVYHLSSEELYARIGKANLFTRRQHSIEFIETRLVVLDFIIANQQYEYLETEDEKVCYFSEALGIPKTALPTKAYRGTPLLGPSLRYFVDHFPMFLDASSDRSGTPLTFCYVDVGEASVAGFRHHLEAYKPLLSSLSAFQFLYLSNTTINFAAAERCFGAFSSALGDDSSAELVPYFTLRARRDREHEGSLSSDEIEWLDQASRRLGSQDTERLYAAWCAGEVAGDSSAKNLTAIPRTRRIRFKLCLVPRGQITPRESKHFGRIRVK